MKESRDAICADAEGNLQSNESLCDETKLPELSQACEEQTEEVLKRISFKSYVSYFFRKPNVKGSLLVTTDVLDYRIVFFETQFVHKFLC